MTKQAIVYGIIMAIAVFFVGWVTGMGGSHLANFAFSFAMGVFAMILFLLAHRLSGRGRGDR